MAAYLIADVDVRDPVAFEEYKREVPETEARYGGRYLGRGGFTMVLEGDWNPHRLVIMEFPDMVSLMTWYESPEYGRLKRIRESCAVTRMIVLEGVSGMEAAAVASP